MTGSTCSSDWEGDKVKRWQLTGWTVAALVVVAVGQVRAAPDASGSATPAPRAAPGDAPRGASGTPAHGAPDGEASAEASRAQATRLFLEGNKSLDSGDYRGALGKFQAAYGIFPSPKLLFNMAQAFNELGRLVEALEHYERFVRDFPKAESPDLFALAHKRIFGLQGQIASLQVETNVVGAVVTVDGKSFGETPITAPIRLLPGPHAVVLSKAGYERQVVQRELGPGSSVIRIELLTEGEAVAKRAEVRRLAEQRRMAEENLRREQEESRRSRSLRLQRLKISGWAVLGTGLAIMVAGSGFGINSLVKTRYVESRPEGTLWSDVAADYRAAEDSRLGFIVGMSVGAAVAATGAIMLYAQYRMAKQGEALPAPIEGPAPSRPSGVSHLRILPSAGPSGLGASLHLVF